MKRLTFLISVLSISISPIANSQSIVQVNPLPNTTYWNQAWGLAPGNGGARLAISSGTTTAVFNRGHIYSSDSLGNIRDSVVTGLSSSQGLAWDGSHYWYIRGSGSTGRIYKVNTAGAIVDSIIPPSTSWFLGGACWDGTGLWVSLYSPNADAGLYKYNVVTKTIVDTIRSIGQQPQGIAWDGQYLYYAMDLNSTEPNQNLIYVVNPTTRDTVRTIPMPEPPNVDSNPRGLAWDGRYLWLVAEPVGASSGRSLYKYDLGGSGTPDINLVPASLDFGLERIDSTYTRTFEIQNVGTAPLIFDIACTLGHWWCGSSTVSPDTIPPGGSVEWQIYNRPFFFGADQFFLPIMSNDPDESFINYRLFGYAIYGPPVMIVPTQLNFGTRRIGTSSSIPLTIQNLGAQRLTISSIVSSLNVFSVDSLAFPIHVDSLQSTTVRVLFTPGTVGNFSAQLQIVSNAAGGGVRQVALSGVGEASSILMGQPFWTYVVPNNPRTSSNQKLMKAVRAISDINGDGKPEVVVSSENYYTMALNGNASVSNDSLWAFNTYIANYSAGSIGSTGDYSHQKALAVADLNRDSFKDVIIGTGGGNEHVYAINGRTGQMLWQFGTDHPDSFSLGDFTGVDASMDFTGDGVPDVLGAAAATETGGVGGRRSVYLFNGTNGHIRWIAPLLGFTHAVTAIPDVNGDGVPDVIGTVGEPSYKFQAFSGANGSELWQLPVPSAQGGGKEVLPWLVAGQSPDAILSAFWGPVYRVNAVNGTIRWQYSTGNRGVLQLARLRDLTGDGVDEVCAALLLGGAVCLNGANGTVIWSLPTGNTMGVAAIPDLNRDGYDDVALAVQNQGVMIVKGQDGAQLALYPTGTQQSREVAIVPDLDGNNSFEIIMGGQQGNVALLSGGSGATSVGGDANVIPKYFELRQNYPNPFNPTTTIEVRLPQQSDFTLTIYDVLGREVRAFKYEKAATGTHQIGWEGNDNAGNQAATGIYVYVFRTKDLLTAKKMLLLR